MGTQNKKVVIVGGSLAGLMHAIVLKSMGHDIHVLERSREESLRSQAAGLSAGPEVQKFISEYIKPRQPYAKAARSVEVINLEGGTINPIPSKEPYQLTTWSLLHNLFKEHLLAGTSSNATYETEKWVQAVKVDGDNLVVVYSDVANQTQHQITADLVIAADGAHSTVRESIFPGTTPQYTGFITWRGVVPATAVSESSRKILEERMLIFRTNDGYTVSYNVPSDAGSIAPEDSQFIWVWYNKIDQDSQEFINTFTDVSGNKHSTTVPRGKVDPEVWTKRKSSGAALSAPFAELIANTTDPFVSAIRESPTPQTTAYDGKLIFVGDAFSLFRPHTGSSTNQAARQALELAEVFRGQMTLGEWQDSSIKYAGMTSAISKAFGDYCFTGQVPDSIAAALKSE